MNSIRHTEHDKSFRSVLHVAVASQRRCPTSFCFDDDDEELGWDCILDQNRSDCSPGQTEREEPSQGPNLLLSLKHNIPSRLLLLCVPFIKKRKREEVEEEMEEEEE